MKASGHEELSPEQEKFGPDYFGYFTREVVYLLSQEEGQLVAEIDAKVVEIGSVGGFLMKGFRAIVNSTRVAGGMAPVPAHSTVPEPQSAVAQLNLPVASSIYRVRTRILPDQEKGTKRQLEAPGERRKPVVDRGGVPAPESKPGHTGWLH
ncbi:hypothetical protein AgCh_028061 [Apium graveolens]